MIQLHNKQLELRVSIAYVTNKDYSGGANRETGHFVVRKFFSQVTTRGWVVVDIFGPVLPSQTFYSFLLRTLSSNIDLTTGAN